MPRKTKDDKIKSTQERLKKLQEEMAELQQERDLSVGKAFLETFDLDSEAEALELINELKMLKEMDEQTTTSTAPTEEANASLSGG